MIQNIYSQTPLIIVTQELAVQPHDLVEVDHEPVGPKIQLVCGDSYSTFSLEQIQGFLKKLGFEAEKWDLYILEDALIQQLLPVFETKSSFKQLEAFFSLIRLLRLTDGYKSREFAETVKIFNQNKSLDIGTEIQICLLANARTLLPLTLGKIFGKKTRDDHATNKLAVKTHSACVKYMHKYTRLIIAELDKLQESTTENIFKIRNDIEIKNFSQELHVFKERAKTVSAIMSYFDPFCAEIYLKFLQNQSTQIIGRIISYKEEIRKIVELYGLKTVVKVTDVIMDSAVPMMKFAKRMDDIVSLQIKILESLAESRTESGLELFKFSHELGLDFFGTEPIVWNKKNCELLKQAQQIVPTLTQKIEIAQKYNKSSLDDLSLNISLDSNEHRFIVDAIDQEIDHLHLWQRNQNHFFSSLVEKYMKTKTSCQENALWLFYGAELIEEEEREKKIQPFYSHKKTKVIEIESTSSSSSDEAECEVQEHVSQNIFLETNQEIETLLHKKASLFNLSEISFNKALRAVNELSDHRHCAALNLMLFAEALTNKDLYAIGAIVSSLCLDLHIQIEQWMKHHLILTTGNYPKTHSLVDLSKLCHFKLSAKQLEFLHQFEHGMIEARYPLALQQERQSVVLQWIHFSLKCARTLPNTAQLFDLISFVFDSYAVAQSFLNETENAQLDLCKNELQVSLSSFDSWGSFDWKVYKSKDNFSKEILKLETDLTAAASKLSDENYRLPLQEAAAHLLRIDMAHHMKMFYTNPQLTPLHERNALQISWVLEQLLICQGMKEGIGDFRWIKNHDICIFHSLLSPDQNRCKQLTTFNFKRTLHYNRDKENVLPLIQNLMYSMNCSKLNIANKLFDKHWKNIFARGIPLLQLLVKETIQ